jgi:uncharacterized protein (TIGR00251 family)
VARIAVHATPKSGRDEIVGWRGAELQVRVTAPPEGGKANAAVCKVLADALGVAKSSVRVARGETSRHKTVEVAGVGEDAVREALGAPDESLF